RFTEGSIRGSYIICTRESASTFGSPAVKSSFYLLEPIDEQRYASVVALVTVQVGTDGPERAAGMYRGIWYSPDPVQTGHVVHNSDGSVSFPDPVPVRVRAYDASGKVLYDSKVENGFGHGCVVTPDGKTLLRNYESKPPAHLSDCVRAYSWPAATH